MNALQSVSRFSLAQRVGTLKVFLPAILAFFPLQAQSQSAPCQLSVGTPEMIALSATQVMSGEYSKFVSSIDPKKKLPDSTRNKLSDGLEEFAPDGFSNCALLTQDSHPNFVASWILFSSDDADLFLFLAVAKIKNEWFAVKVQVSSDFDEIYSFVR
jgi:hypothetical protein